MIPIYPIEATVLQNITDWFAIFISTFFIGLVIVDYFAWCIRCSKQLKKQASEIPNDVCLVFTVFRTDPFWFHIILFAALFYLSSG